MSDDDTNILDWRSLPAETRERLRRLLRDPRSPRAKLRDEAWEAAKSREPQRRRLIFSLVHERLRYGAAADCTADELIVLGYRRESSGVYWHLWIDTPLRERTGISVENFLAVHAASEPGGPSLARCRQILRQPSIQAKLASAKGGLARATLRELADDPDYGALIVIPPLRRALGLEAMEVAPDRVEAVEPGQIDTTVDNTTEPEPELEPKAPPVPGPEPPRDDPAPPASPTISAPLVLDLTAEPPHLRRYRVTEEFPQASEGDMDAAIAAVADADGGQTNRATIRKWARYWVRKVKQKDTLVSTLEARFGEFSSRQPPPSGWRPSPAEVTRETRVSPAQRGV